MPAPRTSARPRAALRRAGLGALLTAAALVLGACGDTFVHRDAVQVGYRGTGMEQTYPQNETAARFATLKVPTPLPPATASPPGPLPWRNVQVLNDISVAEFNRTMIAMSTWVAGTGNCAYCHNLANLAADTTNDGKPLYTKLVARRMLQMTRHINNQYASHVGNTGVTCYTCHGGKPVPANIWFYSDPAQAQRHYLDREGARVVSQTVGPSNANRSSVRQTEWVYGVMLNMSRALNVNCTYCHNSRQFASWTEAPPMRQTAHYGIQMLRDVNQNYLAPLQPVYPQVRLGEMGDAPKAECITCHQGVYKPLYGTQMVKDYPALWGRADWDGTPFPVGSRPNAALQGDTTKGMRDSVGIAPQNPVPAAAPAAGQRSASAGTVVPAGPSAHQPVASRGAQR